MRVEVWVELLALGLAVWAASKSVPRPPRLHWERLFKTTLAALTLRGLSDPRELEAAVMAPLLFQPAGGPEPEKKLLDPERAPIPVPPLEGERALVETLGRLTSLEERFQRMYLADPAAERALVLDDPEALGPDYHPARLGAGLDWEALAGWTEATAAALGRRLGSLILVDLGAEIALEIAEAVPGLRAERLDPAREPEALAEALLALTRSPADRLALLARGPGALAALRALAASMTLRDRLAAVVSLGGPLAESAEDHAWVLENFAHDRLDPELNRAIPYAALVEVDAERPVDPARPDAWAEQRFPLPKPSSSGREAIDAIDLGPIVLSRVPRPRLARALAVFLAFRLSA